MARSPNTGFEGWHFRADPSRNLFDWHILAIQALDVCQLAFFPRPPRTQIFFA
jgi:hypothetical protein